MKELESAQEWGGARGERWSAQLVGVEAFLAPVDAPLLDALALEGPLRIADSACGGGGTTLEIFRRAAPGSTVDGFDISPALIEKARARVTSPGVTFTVANMATTAPEKPYQRLVSRFGTMFFDEPAAAFANLRRWLEPGGRFAFAVWGPQPENEWNRLVGEVVSRFVPVPRPPPEAPSPFRYGDVSKLLALLQAAGFEGTEAKSWRHPLIVARGTPAEAARFALGSFASFSDLLAQAGPAVSDAAHRALADAFAPHHRDDQVALAASVHFVTGTRS